MTCPHCSKTIADDASDCPFCGVAGATATSFDRAPVAKTPVKTWHVFEPGAIIAGRYRVVNLLGQGGMGEVYRADDLTLNQPVAMKFLPPKLASDQTVLARFHHEVRIARNVANPGVCRVFDVGESEGRIFLTMEYIDGEDLAVLLRRIGRLPADKASELSRQICLGVAAAHDAGVLHRDLKPANIMVDSRGRAHITDFGVAGLAADLKDDASRAGTPAYMAPEQLAGSGVSPQSDIFSLGLILYEMYTGKRAYEGATLADLMRAQTHSSPSRPSIAIADIDPQAERAILQCLERNPAARPRSALEVARAFPGDDPLAAAIAAGETPSPEMVAASGGEGSLKLPYAWGLFAATLLAIAGVVALAPRSTDLGLAPLESSPDVMTHRAQELTRKFGYKDAPVDTGFWYERNHLKATSQGRTKFFYRQSPVAMMARENRRDLTMPAFVLTRELPPHNVSGMAMVVLEPDGSLDEFLAVPPQAAPTEKSASLPDWNALFAESGLDAKRFEPESPVWTSPVAFDASMGWKGSYAQDPSTAIHVVAAACQGRPVYFRVIAPWNLPERDTSARTSMVLKLAQIVWILLGTVLLAIGVFMVWRNFNKGRTDFEGFIKLTVFQVAVLIVSWMLLSHHPPDANLGYLTYIFGMGQVLYFTLLSAGAYLAVEPYVRRRFPEMITSWTRLVRGDWRDPLVGRHVLIGVCVGALFALLRSVLDASSRIPRQGFLLTLESLPSAFGVMVTYIGMRNSVSFAFIFLLLLFRAITGRRWMAEVITALIMSPGLHRPGPIGYEGPIIFLWGGVLTLLASRVGVVAIFAFDITQAILQGFPLTLDTASWYFSRSLLALTITVGIAGYAFYTSLGGQPAFGVGGRRLDP